MNLQGYLTDASGNPINGVKSLVFKIYREGNLQWQEAQQCTVQAGLFCVVLGRLVPITPNVFEPGTPCELDVNVEGQPLTPRVEITSNGYAFRSVKSDSALYFPRPISPALTSAEIADGAVTMAKVHQAGAVAGQVIKWNGTTWAPAPDSAGGGGGGVTSVGQGNGITCTPNPIVSTGTVAINTSYIDDRYIRNQDAATQTANFKIDGGGQAQQFSGISATNDVPAVWGSGETYCAGVYGDAGNVNYAAVMGINTHNTGTGMVGVGNDDQAMVMTDGSGGAFSGRGIGLLGYASDINNLPIMGGAFQVAGTPANYSYLALWDELGYGYRCIGSGECAQGLLTRDGVRAAFSVSSPAPCLEDRGHGQLVRGHARIELDPYYRDCISVSGPLDVFVQLNGDCNGVYVTSDDRGFDVRELNGGTSNVPFTWRVVAATKGHEHMRFPAAPTPAAVRTAGRKPAKLETFGK
jgi:hypothetical protein